jgi:hypothetical protein
MDIVLVECTVHVTFIQEENFPFKKYKMKETFKVYFPLKVDCT